LSFGHFQRFMGFRVGTKVERVVIAIRLHAAQVPIDDTSVHDQGGGWVVVGRG
jgi:hypothetical protein